MHSKRRCKICICSVILGELESFRNYKGLSIIFPKILDEIWRITKVRHFLIPLSTTFLNSMKNSLTWEEKCENWTSENFREFTRQALKIVHEWNGRLEIFSRPEVRENSRQYLLLGTDHILKKTVVGGPWIIKINYLIKTSRCLTDD